MAKFKLGFYSAWVAAIAAACYTVSQILQVIGLVGKPLDDILIFGFSLCIAPPFLMAMLTLHYSVEQDKKIWTHAALLFAVMYNTFVLLMYVVQLASVIPYGVTDPVLTVTPHSLFWDIDALGYMNMGLSTLFAVPALRNDRTERYAKWFFLAHGLVTPIVGFVYFSPKFSIPLLLMASPWSITACGSTVFLAYLFKGKLLGGYPEKQVISDVSG